MLMSGKTYGKGSRTCKLCGTHQAIIRRYGLNICRRCFREHAKQIGFKKYS
ncbi:MAG: 30S ribosomal protein S14 [Candidatus Odinarchaeum yellowstonii]|uniref:30S ribosomal protein S14 n=1 Tax=Odinarchaeota yellowstonii (strain LCB_4) TaxID=1841599 RepID=A0AAF0IAX4_ODILC|nr:MAG: 30S ribosomal protein S14 [Candidatus Odinarchaeum yellowstonii]